MGMKLPVFVAIALTGLAVSGLLRAPMEDGQSGSTIEVATSPDEQLGVSHGGWGGETVLDRNSDGHFYADVTVDGRDYRMLVDTGASVIALTAADAEAMGLTWDDAELAVVAQGASGPVEGIHTTIHAVTLGDHAARDVQAIIVPQGLTVSLLGQSFLKTLGNVQMNGDAMVLGSSAP
jgi:aspartyl protease family protein